MLLLWLFWKCGINANSKRGLRSLKFALMKKSSTKTFSMYINKWNANRMKCSKCLPLQQCFFFLFPFFFASELFSSANFFLSLLTKSHSDPPLSINFLVFLVKKIQITNTLKEEYAIEMKFHSRKRICRVEILVIKIHSPLLLDASRGFSRSRQHVDDKSSICSSVQVASLGHLR